MLSMIGKAQTKSYYHLGTLTEWTTTHLDHFSDKYNPINWCFIKFHGSIRV